MITLHTAGAALALALAIATTAAPALAKSGTGHRGFEARAQAVEVLTDEGVTAARARALRECNARISGFKGHTQMSTPMSMYRSCMNEHGELE